MVRTRRRSTPPTAPPPAPAPTLTSTSRKRSRDDATDPSRDPPGDDQDSTVDEIPVTTTSNSRLLKKRRTIAPEPTTTSINQGEGGADGTATDPDGVARSASASTITLDGNNGAGGVTPPEEAQVEVKMEEITA
ncbi:hypothetical protein JCM5296_005231, partial [Sporobolomyces johnsonii]